MLETISSSIEYEAALVAALAYAESHPEPGQPEFEAMTDLFGQIVSYRRVQPEAARSPAESLEARIDAFAAKRHHDDYFRPYAEPEEPAPGA